MVTVSVFLFVMSKVLWGMSRISKSLTPKSLSELETTITKAYVITHDLNAISSGIRLSSLFFNARNSGSRAFLFDLSLCFFWVLWIWVYLHDKNVLSAFEFFRSGNLNAIFLMGAICAAVVLFAHSVCTRTMLHSLSTRSTQKNSFALLFFIAALLILWTFACLANGLFGSFSLVGLGLRNNSDITFLLTFDWIANRFWVAFAQPFASSIKIELPSTGRYVYSWAILVPAVLAPAIVLIVLGIAHLLERYVLQYRSLIGILFSKLDNALSVVRKRTNISTSTYVLFRIAAISCLVLSLFLM